MGNFETKYTTSCSAGASPFRLEQSSQKLGKPTEYRTLGKLSEILKRCSSNLDVTIDGSDGFRSEYKFSVSANTIELTRKGYQNTQSGWTDSNFNQKWIFGQNGKLTTSSPNKNLEEAIVALEDILKGLNLRDTNEKVKK